MQFSIHPKHRRNNHLRAVLKALAPNCPMLMGNWDGVLKYEPDLVYLELYENGEPGSEEPDAVWAAFGDRPAQVIAGWLIGQLWRHWES